MKERMRPIRATGLQQRFNAIASVLHARDMVNSQGGKMSVESIIDMVENMPARISPVSPEGNKLPRRSR